MNLHGRIPVEPLDEERLTNIERKLVVAVSDMRAPAERLPRRLLAFASVAMAVAIAGFVGWRLRGDGAVVAEDEVETFAVNTDRGHTIQLGDARLGAIALTSGAATDLRVERGRDVVVYMARGSIDLAIEHKPGRSVVVKAGDTEIEDIGTRFTVEYDGKNKLAVRVTEGEVKVKRDGKHEDIQAGLAWTSELGKLTIAELDTKQAAAVIAMGDPQVPSADPPDARDIAPPTADPGSGGAGGAADTNAGNVNAGNGNAGNKTAAHGTRKVGRPNAREALLAAPLDPPHDVGTKDAKDAIAKYLDLLKPMPEGEDKSYLLYSMAYVQHMAKNDSAAEHLISGVLKRQGGPAYRSAMWLDVRIHCAEAFDDKCRKAADVYRRKFPDGVHTGIADEILREILRQ